MQMHFDRAGNFATTNADLYQQCRLAGYVSKFWNKHCLFALSKDLQFHIYVSQPETLHLKWSHVVGPFEANSYVGSALSIVCWNLEH